MSSTDHCTVYQWCCGLVKTKLVLVTVLDTVSFRFKVLGLKNLFHEKQRHKYEGLSHFPRSSWRPDDKSAVSGPDTKWETDDTAIKHSFVYALRLNTMLFQYIRIVHIVNITMGANQNTPFLVI